METGILCSFHIKFPQHLCISLLRPFTGSKWLRPVQGALQQLDEALPSGCPQACVPHLLS